MKIDPLILFFFVAANGAAAFFLMASRILTALAEKRGSTRPKGVATEAKIVTGSDALKTLFETFEPEPDLPATRGETRLAESLERWRDVCDGGESLPDAADSRRVERVA